MNTHSYRFVCALVSVVTSLLVCASHVSAAILPAAEEGSVHVNHIDLHYRVQGAGETIIFIHGMLSNYQVWDNYTPAFVNKYQVITYSRRNNWPNVNKFLITRDPLAVDRDDIYWLMRHRKILKAHLVGEGYGAAVALAFAARYPTMTSSVSLIEPALLRWLVDEPGQNVAWQQFVDSAYVPAKRDILAASIEPAVKAYVENVQPGDLQTMAPADLSAMYRSVNDLRAALLATGGYPSIDRLDVRKVRIPVLVVIAEKAPASFDAIGREVATITGGGPVDVVKGVNRAMSPASVKDVEASIVSFLGSIPPAVDATAPVVPVVKPMPPAAPTKPTTPPVTAKPTVATPAGKPVDAPVAPATPTGVKPGTSAVPVVPPVPSAPAK
ncbi:MAG TPA: alpha/beta hydrolase [Capsulimonadaceae bacterium]|jgi:pimeloyl-ACP methyl ester carboxylesterase